ncbi:hypothetical protein HOG48_04975 [Candidatus Peregrinibacteria bacterium]|nr:hypothetical protein [Candidatus Peregrinibacteria bacterium]
MHVGKPLERIKQFKETFKHLKSGVYNIVCGDFNTADTPYLQPFNWIMGSSLKEALPFYPERKNLEKLFGDYGLKNPLRGQRTHVANCQLDHILVPTPVKVLKKGVQKDPVGSDHKPVFVEINRITPSCQALTVGKTI